MEKDEEMKKAELIMSTYVIPLSVGRVVKSLWCDSFCVITQKKY